MGHYSYNVNYYTEEYKLYAEELQDLEKLEEYKTTLENSVAKSSIALKNTINNFSDLTSLAVDDLNIYMNGFFDNLKIIEDYLNNQLGIVLSSCDSLHEHLPILEDLNEKVREKYSKLNELYNNPVSKGKYNEETKKYSNIDNYNKYIESINTLKQEIEPLEKQCKDEDEIIKEDLEIINDFNTFSIDLTNQLYAFTTTFDNAKLSGFKDLPLSKKYDVLTDLIEELTDKYNEIKRNQEYLKEETFNAVLKSLGCFFLDPYKPFSYEGYLAVVDFVNHRWGNNKVTSEIINDYFNGESWSGSGMDYLAASFTGISLNSEFFSHVDPSLDPTKNGYVYSKGNEDESIFWYNLLYNLAGESIENQSELYYNSDYFKEHGGGATIEDLWDALNMSSSSGGRVYPPNESLIDSLKKQFVDEGRLDAIISYMDYLENADGRWVDAYGTTVLHALDGNIDWTDNNAAIPKDAILSYLGGEKSWEESGLATYCNKTEKEFLLELLPDYGRDYVSPLFNYTTNEWEFADSKEIYGGTHDFFECDFPITRDKFIQMINDDKDVTKYVEMLKKDAYWMVDNRYDYITNRNNTIAVQNYELSILDDAVRGVNNLKSNLEAIEFRQNGFEGNSFNRLASYGKSLIENNGLPDIDTSIMDGYDYDFLWENMDDEQRETFYAYYGTSQYGNTNRAKEYLASQADIINSRVGYDRAENYVRYILNDETSFISQDSYTNRIASEKGISVDQARELTTKKMQDDYMDMLIEVKHYNPECARQAALNHDFSGEKVYVGTNASFGDYLETTGKGALNGVIDLGENIWHNISPSMAKTVNQYEGDYITMLLSDENSDYYNAGLGSTYSGARTIAHNAPAVILKSLPSTTAQAVGNAIDTLDSTGAQINATYQATGGNLIAAYGDVAGDALAEVVANKMTSGMSGAGKAFTKTFVKGSIKAGSDYVFLHGDEKQLKNDILDSALDASVDALVSTVDVKVDTKSEIVNKIAENVVEDQIGIYADGVKEAIKTGDASELGKTILEGEKNFASIDAEKVANAGLNALGDTIKNQFERHSLNKTLDDAVDNDLFYELNGHYYNNEDGKNLGTKDDVIQLFKDNSDFLKATQEQNQHYDRINELIESGVITNSNGSFKFQGVEIGTSYDEVANYFFPS